MLSWIQEGNGYLVMICFVERSHNCRDPSADVAINWFGYFVDTDKLVTGKPLGSIHYRKSMLTCKDGHNGAFITTQNEYLSIRSADSKQTVLRIQIGGHQPTAKRAVLCNKTVKAKLRLPWSRASFQLHSGRKTQFPCFYFHYRICWVRERPYKYIFTWLAEMVATYR